MTPAPRPAPISFRPSSEHKRLMEKALELAGITKRQKFWFPRLMTIILTHYVETIERDLRDVARLKDKIEEMEKK